VTVPRVGIGLFATSPATTADHAKKVTSVPMPSAIVRALPVALPARAAPNGRAAKGRLAINLQATSPAARASASRAAARRISQASLRAIGRAVVASLRAARRAKGKGMTRGADRRR
jgi:hypothetical protein